MNASWFPEFHQVAIHVPDHQHQESVDMLSVLGHSEWTTDTASLFGEMWNPQTAMYEVSSVEGMMSFNYTMLGGRELEVLSYRGRSHHSLMGTTISNPRGFISHMSAHTEDVERDAAAVIRNLELAGMPSRVVHRFETFNHTNPAIAGKKRFKEVVIGTRFWIGYDIKFIQRLAEGPWTI